MPDIYKGVEKRNTFPFGHAGYFYTSTSTGGGSAYRAENTHVMYCGDLTGIKNIYLYNASANILTYQIFGSYNDEDANLRLSTFVTYTAADHSLLTAEATLAATTGAETEYNNALAFLIIQIKDAGTDDTYNLQMRAN